MLSNPLSGLRPVGFIDDNPGRIGKLVNGYLIICDVNGLSGAITRTGAQAVVISSQKVTNERVLQARHICDRVGVRLVRMNIGFEEAMPVSGTDGKRPAAVAEARG
jgi:UDP-GlcNAc:undecaprenyl-phosphate GlcNAc-1-phosphate transferase